MKLWVLGLRRSGTTILFDALREDAGLRCVYEPLREEAETVGGGSGARAEDAFAETRALREAFRAERFPRLHPELFNWGGPRSPELELESELPEHVSAWLAAVLDSAPRVAVKETRLQHKLGALAGLDPAAAVVHVVRDPRAVTASMLLGRRRRADLYPDADAFFRARTGRRLWSSRRISEELIRAGRAPGLPADVPDFLRPLLVWHDAFEATATAGASLFGDRYAIVRLEDLSRDPGEVLARIYSLGDREPPAAVTEWAARNLRRDPGIHLERDPRWARAARLLGMEGSLAAAGYAKILDLEEAPAEPLDLSPPTRGSRLAGLVGRARRRLAER